MFFKKSGNGCPFVAGPPGGGVESITTQTKNRNIITRLTHYIFKYYLN